MILRIYSNLTLFPKFTLKSTKLSKIVYNFTKLFLTFIQSVYLCSLKQRKKIFYIIFKTKVWCSLMKAFSNTFWWFTNLETNSEWKSSNLRSLCFLLDREIIWLMSFINLLLSDTVNLSVLENNNCWISL